MGFRPLCITILFVFYSIECSLEEDDLLHCTRHCTAITWHHYPSILDDHMTHIFFASLRRHRQDSSSEGRSDRVRVCFLQHNVIERDEQVLGEFVSVCFVEKHRELGPDCQHLDGLCSVFTSRLKCVQCFLFPIGRGRETDASAVHTSAQGATLGDLLRRDRCHDVCQEGETC